MMQAESNGCTCYDETTRQCPIHAKEKQNDHTNTTVRLLEHLHDSNRSVSAETLSDVLKERDSRYGDFTQHALISQQLKKFIETYGSSLNTLHREALDMIFHKIARILNGDPNYTDSWIDIAGYAQLVVDRLQRAQNTPQM